VLSVLTGASTAYLAEYQGYKERLVALDETLAIDIPATDVQLVSCAEPAQNPSEPEVT